MGEGHSAATEQGHWRGCCGGRVKKKWSVSEVATMVGGFIVFWPLGLLALGAKLVKGEMWPGASENIAPWKAWKKPEGFEFAQNWKSNWQPRQSSGNAAFDEYKRTKLEELEAARRKLEDEQKAFADYLSKLREAKDRDEFDKFMAERNAITPLNG